MRTIFCLASALLIVLPQVARAEPTYPAEIQSHLGLDFTPPCTLCHATNNGGLGTVTAPFGKALMARGMTTNIATLDPALDALGSSNIDSDGDGVSDIQQLKNGFDPSTGAHLSNVEPQRFGCGARIALSRANVSGQLLVLASLVFVALSRRRKMTPSSIE